MAVLRRVWVLVWSVPGCKGHTCRLPTVCTVSTELAGLVVRLSKFTISPTKLCARPVGEGIQYGSNVANASERSKRIFLTFRVTPHPQRLSFHLLLFSSFHPVLDRTSRAWLTERYKLSAASCDTNALICGPTSGSVCKLCAMRCNLLVSIVRERQHRADRFALVHEVKCLVGLFHRKSARDLS